MQDQNSISYNVKLNKTAILKKQFELFYLICNEFICEKWQKISLGKGFSVTWKNIDSFRAIPKIASIQIL